MPKLQLKIEGLERASRIPGWLEDGQRDFFHAALRELSQSVASKAPGGPTGRIGRTIYGRTLSSTVGLIGTEHPGARALDRGAYITAKKGKVLRFEVDGEEVFTRFVRIEPRRFFARGLRYRNRIVQEQFNRHMGNLG